MTTVVYEKISLETYMNNQYFWLENNTTNIFYVSKSQPKLEFLQFT